MRIRFAVLPACFSASAVLAAGHFDIDDAFILDPGQCQVELWGGRFGADPAIGDLHVGSGCRVGPVELAFNVDRYSAASRYGWVVGPQVKWTFFGEGADSRFAAGLSASASFDVTQGGPAGGQLVLPVSWQPVDKLWINANLGYDWTPYIRTRTARGGLQADWSFDDRVELVVERFKAFDLWTSRLGLRFNVAPDTSIDVSAARTGRAAATVYVIGLTRVFGPN